MISITVCYCNSTASLLVFSTDMAVATAVEIQGSWYYKTNPNFLHYYRGNPSNLPIHWVVFDSPKDGSYNLMTPDIETYLNDLMTEWQHKWQTSSPLSFFGDNFFQVHLEHLLFLPMDSLPSKSEMHKNRRKKIRAETVDLAQPPLWSRYCLMVQSHPEKHGSTGLDVLKTLGKY